MAIETQKLRVELDRLFSLFIRAREADFQGYVRCYTCPAIIEWKNAQCGHFIRRANSSVRYHENNCRPQCFECNMVYNGKEEVFEEELREEIGDQAVEEIIKLGKKEKHYSEEELKDLIHFYRRILRAKNVII